MVALTEKGLSDAIQEYIEKDEKDAIAELINFQIEKIQKYLKTEVKWQNEFQLEQEIKSFQQMRLSNQEEEDQEIKGIFEKTRKNTQPTAQRKYEDSDEEITSSKKKPINLESDEDIDEEIEIKATSGRGRGAVRATGTRGRGRGSRGGRGGRGAKAAVVEEEKASFFQATRSQRTQSTIKKPVYTLEDSDQDVIDLEEEETKPKTSNTIKQMSTTPSVRRTRIQYDDDDEDDLMSNYNSSKKVKASQEEDSEITNTFSIFKKMAKKK